MSVANPRKKYSLGRSKNGGREQRCPICEFKMYQGSQLSCEPGVCMYRDVPHRYEAKRLA